MLGRWSGLESKVERTVEQRLRLCYTTPALFVNVFRMPNQLIGIDKGMATIRVEVLVETLEPYLKDAAGRLSSRIKLEGFRPGKAPYDVVKQRLGETAIYEEAADRIVSKTFAAAVAEHNLVTVGPPEISLEKLAPGNPIIYKASVALMPNVTKVEYASLKARRSVLPVTDQEVDKAIEDLRRLRAKEAAVSRPAQRGDRVDLNFRLFLDDVPVDGGQAEHYPTRLGDGNLVPGFEDQLVGMTAGQEKTFTVTFPKDNPNKQLAGRPVEVKAKIEQVFQIDLPTLDDAFAKSLGAFTTVDELRDKLKENLAAERNNEADSKFELDLLNEVLAKAEFDPIPELLRHAETSRMIRELEQDIVRRGLKWADYLQHMKKTEDELRKEFVPSADKRLKSALILRSIADRENITIPDDELTATVEEQKEAAAARGVLDDRISSDDYRDSVRGHLRNKKVIDLLKSRVK